MTEENKEETKKCKDCQSDIAKKAKKCPHCQADQRNWFRRHPIMTGIGILILFVMIVSASGDGDKGDTKTDSNNAPESSETVTVEKETTDDMEVAEKVFIKVNTREFVDEFDENQVAAETNWKGKYIEFSAEISNITDSGISFYNVGSDEFSLAQISCDIEDSEQLLPLKKGQMITVRGVVGSQTFGVIDINECEVVE